MNLRRATNGCHTSARRASMPLTQQQQVGQLLTSLCNSFCFFLWPCSADHKALWVRFVNWPYLPSICLAPSLQSLLYIKKQCVQTVGSHGMAGVTSWWRTILKALQMPRWSATTQREEGEAFWLASTLLTARRWSALISMQVNEKKYKEKVLSTRPLPWLFEFNFKQFHKVMFSCVLWSVRWPVVGRVDRSDRYRHWHHRLQVGQPGTRHFHLLGPKPTSPAHSEY